MNVKCISNLFLWLLLFFTQIAHSQTNTVEVLETELKLLNVDSLRLRTMKKIAVALRNTDPSRQKQYSQAGLDLATKTADLRHQLLFYRELGIHYKKSGSLDSAFYHYKKAQDLAEQISDQEFYQATNISLGNLKKTQGKYDEATQHFMEAIAYYEPQQDKRSQTIYMTASFNLAGLLTRIKKYDRALTMFKSVANHPLAQNNDAIMRGTFTNLLAVYTKTNEPDSALCYALKAEKLAIKTNSNRSLAHIYTNMGALYEQKEAYVKAVSSFKKARKLYAQLNDQPGIARSENNIGNIQARQGLFSSSENSLLKAQVILRESTDAYSLEHNYVALTSLYTRQKRFEQAYLIQDKLFQLKDSLLGLEKTKAIEEIEIKYQVEKEQLLTQNALKEKKLAEVKAEKSRIYLAFSGAGGGLLLVSSTLYLFLFKARKKRELLSIELDLTQKQLQAEYQYRQSELKALKAQMNPHFLFNAINSVQALVLKGDKHEAYRYLSKFSHLTRQNLHMSEKHFVYLDQELELIRNYLDLEQLRFNHTLTYEITGTDDLEEIRVYPMIIQPFMENAIKHGLFHKPGPKTLKVHFEKAEVLICTIEDNGIGRDAARVLQQNQSVPHDSFSTGAIEKQLELLGIQYETELGFSISDIEDQGQLSGTRVVLKIPYLSDHE